MLSIEVRVQPRSIELSGILEPRDRIQTKFSVTYATATALVYGKATLRHFDDPYVDDPAIRALFERADIAYIHAHNAAHGCFAARIDRN